MSRMIQVSDSRVVPETEMTPEQVSYYDRQPAQKPDAPKTPLEAAIDRATGFADAAEAPGTKEAVRVVNLYVKKNGRYGSPGSQPKTDWVEEAYKCFIKDASDIDPTDPVKAVEAYFEKNASDELKARCKAEGKDAEGCWSFVEAVARKALHGSSGHIDPGVVYAIAMHWFENVPKYWDKAKSEPGPEKKSKPKKPAETPTEVRREKERAKKAKAKPAGKKAKKKPQQMFFFDLIETPDAAAESEVG